MKVQLLMFQTALQIKNCLFQQVCKGKEQDEILQKSSFLFVSAAGFYKLHFQTMPSMVDQLNLLVRQLNEQLKHKKEEVEENPGSTVYMHDRIALRKRDVNFFSERVRGAIAQSGNQPHMYQLIINGFEKDAKVISSAIAEITVK